MDFNFENCLKEGLKNLTSKFLLVLFGYAISININWLLDLLATWSWVK